MANLRLAIDPTGMESGGRRGESALDRIIGKSKKAENSVTSLASKAGKALGALAAGYAGIAGISAAVRGISEFDGSISKLGAVSRASASELKNLRAVAMDLGSSTEFSASQAADGLNFLAMAGFSASESMAAIPDVLNLATAAALDLGTAADISSNIMSGFGIQAEKTARVTDILTAASTRSNTTVAQLGGAMSTVAPIASALGINLADTAAAIGVMSDAGIQGERAGTALRGVLASLAGPTKAATDALAKYGLTASDVNPETNALADIMAKLAERGLSTSDAMTIFGREAASGALVLAGASRRLGEFGEELRNVDGETRRAADGIRDNLKGDIDSLKSAMEGLILTIGSSGLTGALRAVVQGATDVARAVTSMTEAIGPFQGYAISAAAAITALYIPAIWGAVTATGAWVASLITLKGALIATGLGAFIVGSGYVINKLLELVDRTGGWGNALSLLGDVAVGVWDGIVTSAGAIPGGLEAVWGSVKAGFFGMVSELMSAWSSFLADLNVQSSQFKIPGTEGMGPDLLGKASGAAMASAGKYDARAQSAARQAGAASSAASAQAAAGFDKAREALAKLTATVSDNTKETDSGAESVGGLASSVEAVNTALGGGGSGGTKGAARGASGAVNDFASEIERLELDADPVRKYNQEVGKLLDLMDSGLSESAFHHAVAKLQDGLNTGKQGLSDLQRGFESFKTSAASAFEGLITGAKSFKEALADVLSNLASVLAQSAFSGFFGGLFPSADGNVFSGGSHVTAYANGGVVNGPTLFPMRGNQTGLMGEAGPEAIMPLTRGKNGKLGVQMEGGGGGGPTFAPVYNIDARGADAGAVPRIEQALAKANAEFEGRAINAFNMGKKRRQIV